MSKKINIDLYSLLRVSCAILLAVALAIGVIYMIADDPVLAINKFFLGPFQSKRYFFNIIEKMIPLVFTGLALNIMHRSGTFSMIADSSLYIGGVVAAIIAIRFEMASGIHQVVIIGSAALVGGIIATFPAYIKKFSGASELVTSLMMNYMFYYFGLWIIMTYYIDKTMGAQSLPFLATANLGNIVTGTRLHYGFYIMLACLIIMYFVVEKSKLGRELKVIGSNPNFAKYAGISITSSVIASQFIGGMLAGIGGAVEMIGMNKRFNWLYSVAFVWDGILINLLAGSKPLFIPLSAFFLSYIRVGADIMSLGTNVSNEIVSVIQAIIILLIASERFMYRFKKKREEAEALKNQNINDEAVEA